jgi:putative transposase
MTQREDESAALGWDMVCDVKRIERVRLYPTPRQEDAFRFMLDVTRQLYNAALQHRRDAYRMCGVSISAKQQYAELTALRKPIFRLDTRLAAVYRECEDAVLHRLDLAFAAFFRRIKRGETPGFPRFKPAARWKQIEFPHGDRALRFVGGRVTVPGVGNVKLRKGRRVPEERGRAWIVEKNGRYYACFECERAVQPLPATGNTIGVDRGVHVLAATSEGELIRNGRLADKHRRVVTGHARALDAATVKDKKGRPTNWRDPKRIAAVRRLARAKERETNARRDALHKAAHRIVASADVIGLEELNLRGMTRSAKGTIERPGRNVAAKSGLNRAMLDAGFGILRRLIGEKAESAVRRIVDVDARFSSQTCSKCGTIAAESRLRRRFVCVACGFRLHADVNAALEIRRRAQLALTSEPYPAEDAGRRARCAA